VAPLTTGRGELASDGIDRVTTECDRAVAGAKESDHSGRRAVDTLRLNDLEGHRAKVPVDNVHQLVVGNVGIELEGQIEVTKGNGSGGFHVKYVDQSRSLQSGIPQQAR
jgi:hypothetical protein